MLRTNLSTRPFYNERAVQLLLALAALLVVLLTAFNAIRIFSLSRQNTELSSLINRDRQEAQRLTREAQRIRAGINVEELQATADAAAVANALIDQRTFSWTEFFNRIEETLPPDVMLTAVQPSFGRDGTTIQMSVLGRRIEDIDEFMEKLEATGAFHDVLPTQEDTTDEGLHRLMVRSTYTGTVSEAPEAATPAQAEAGAREAGAREAGSEASRRRGAGSGHVASAGSGAWHATRALVTRRSHRTRRHRTMIDVRRIVSEHRRVVYLIVGALLVNIALYALVVFPLARRVQTGEQQAGDATRELVAAQKVFASARGTVTGKKEADVELLKFYQDVLPADLSEARRVLYPRLTQLASSAKLTTVRSNFEPPEEGKTGDLRQAGDDADRLGRIRQRAALHSSARNGAGVPGARERVGDDRRGSRAERHRARGDVLPGFGQWQLSRGTSPASRPRPVLLVLLGVLVAAVRGHEAFRIGRPEPARVQCEEAAAGRADRRNAGDDGPRHAECGRSIRRASTFVSRRSPSHGRSKGARKGIRSGSVLRRRLRHHRRRRSRPGRRRRHRRSVRRRHRHRRRSP